MQLYEMQVSKTAITRAAPARVPKGLVGAVVKLSFSPEWEGLTKTVVFRAGEITKDILDVKDAAVIPAECTQEMGALLEIGVYGVDAGNTVAIPTLWAAIGRVSEAADPSGDVTTDPQLPVWAQLQAHIRQLEEQGVTQSEVEQALREFFGGERPTGKITSDGGEIFNDYENNKALARYAKAEGQGTVAAAQCQHVQGRYNAEDTEKAHIVGGGTSDTDRKNIYTMDWDGNAEFAGKVYSGGVELAQIGLVYSAIRIASGTDEDLMAEIDGIYAQMADNTVRYISVNFGEKHPTLGGTSYLVTIYRCTNIYGYLEAGTYNAFEFRRVFNETAWKEWEWVNPVLGVGTEYRTTELYNGKPVYAKVVDMGTMPNATKKQVLHKINGIEYVIDFRVLGRDAYDNILYISSASGQIASVTNTAGVNGVYVWVNTTANLSLFSGQAYMKYTKS